MRITSFTANYMSVSHEPLIGNENKLFMFIKMYHDIYEDKICLTRGKHYANIE